MLYLYLLVSIIYIKTNHHEKTELASCMYIYIYSKLAIHTHTRTHTVIIIFKINKAQIQLAKKYLLKLRKEIKKLYTYSNSKKKYGKMTFQPHHNN